MPVDFIFLHFFFLKRLNFFLKFTVRHAILYSFQVHNITLCLDPNVLKVLLVSMGEVRLGEVR